MPDLDPAALTDPSSNDEILDIFLAYLIEQGIEPYDHQEEAILELFAGNNVILNTPTGSGKSLVALALQFRAICQRRRSFYTVPVKALANEKFLSLCKTFGPERVGMITGDATVNAEAPVICCTAEILANLALREGAAAEVDEVIMDEFHYYSDVERGVAWQVPLLTLPRAQFLLMSATLGETAFFEKSITDLTGTPTVLVKSEERPVPLEFEYSTTLLEEKVEELVEASRAPIYLVHFTQRACAETAQDLMSRNFCSKAQKAEIAEILVGADFRSPYGKEMKKLLRHGLGIHHAGLLPKYRVTVEKLAQRGLLKVICGTDTLGVGVNVPIRTVLFTQLFKFGGQSTKTLAVRDFKQISGRAGRRGFDDVGYVVAQAPAHVIENLKSERKAESKGKKSKVVKKQAPERGFVMWDETTFRRLIDAPSEQLSSAFNMRHGMLLNVLSRRDEDGCEELRRLINICHETPVKKQALRRRAFSLFRGLVEGGVLDIIPKAARTGPAKVALNIELQEDFTLNQALGIYLLEAIPQLDREDIDYPINVISMVEAILEDPAAVLRKQVDLAKSELMGKMKAEGIEYDERIERLEEVEHPKPGKEFIYQTYNAFIVDHPWAKEASVRPKSIAREMFIEWQSFDDYIKTYGLERSEAVLLRHLSEVYKVLAQTVPPALKTPELEEVEAFFEEIVRGVDSSLLDEWERLRNPDFVPAEREKPVTEKKPQPLTRNRTAFTRAVRNRVFDFVKELSRDNLQAALELIAENAEGGEWTVPRLTEAMSGYWEEHGRIRLDPEARNAKHSHIDEVPDERRWQVEQVLIDPEELNDWSAVFDVNLEKSDTEGVPVLALTKLGPVAVH
ncbi:MAG: superfamily II RNA helicase [Limisphaerales bacterium]|jgi:superfamily II RNA helicase